VGSSLSKGLVRVAKLEPDPPQALVYDARAMVGFSCAVEYVVIRRRGRNHLAALAVGQKFMLARPQPFAYRRSTRCTPGSGRTTEKGTSICGTRV